jgi:pimeloyl-ACP methyl ester carboxylesterase
MRYVRADPMELPILAELLPQLETLVEIIGGLWDRAVPPSNHRCLHERLATSKLDLIDAGHLTWEDAANQYAEIVTQLVEGHARA